MTEPTARPARVDDRPTLLALLIDDDLGWQREAPTGGADRTVPADYRDAFDAIDADPRNELVVAERDGEVVAVMQLSDGRRRTGSTCGSASRRHTRA
ncbi:hypothetical protein [Micromonospora sp. LOL_023]|uniref:hypothetical protein n=1 Tax=Micromonospora sp. LOL_023 TaxID=3345418 RepID=UPI003A839D57